MYLEVSYMLGEQNRKNKTKRNPAPFYRRVKTVDIMSN